MGGWEGEAGGGGVRVEGGAAKVGIGTAEALLEGGTAGGVSDAAQV